MRSKPLSLRIRWDIESIADSWCGSDWQWATKSEKFSNLLWWTPRCRRAFRRGGATHEIHRTVAGCGEVHLGSTRNVIRRNRSDARFEWIGGGRSLRDIRWVTASL
jgi:hypothetical protein